MMTDTATALTFAADSIATGLVLNAPSEIVEGVEIATDALVAVPTEFAAEAERIRALLPEINDALEQPVFDAFAAETKRIRAALASGQLRPVPRMLDELAACLATAEKGSVAEHFPTSKPHRKRAVLNLTTTLKRAAKAGLAVTGVTFGADGAVTGITVDHAPSGNDTAFDETPEHLRKLV
jgi:hypothetical protein